MNYTELNASLQGRNANRRKLANNTYAERRELGAIAIRLHATDILTFNADGSIVVSSGGWKTSTTKARINDYLPKNAPRVGQHKGLWSWYNWQATPPIELPFTDGDIVGADGKVKAQRESNGAEHKLRKSVLKYAKLYAAAIPLPHPSGGDCWHCCLKSEAGRSLGDETGNADHIRSHIDEGYVVPSLALSAAREAGWTDHLIAGVFRADAGCFGDFARERIGKAVAQFCYRRLGLAAGGGRAVNGGFAVR
jgi:hypothetical protein